MSSFGLYLIGFIVLAAGLLFGASLLGVSQTWLFVIGLVLVGIGIIAAVTNTRRRDSTPTSE